jgi:hypothetical protein
MKAFTHNKQLLALTSKKLITIQSKNLNKTFRPSYYNLRLYFSNMKRNDLGYGKWDMVYGPEGFEKVNLKLNNPQYRLKQTETLITLNTNLICFTIQYMN